jgi:hypothetical protein
MSNNGNSLALPDDYAAQLMSGIAQARAVTKIPGFGGKDLLRMNEKDGTWNFGQSKEDVQAGSRWVVNTRSIMHGYTCWVERGKKNELALDAMVPVTQDKGVQPPPIEGKECKDTRSFDLKCLDGADKDLEAHYKSASLGCISAVDVLMGKVYSQVAVDRVYFCPVITLESEKYWNAKWGKDIYKPIFRLVGWANMNGELAPDASAEPALPLNQAEPDPVKAAPPKPAKPPLEAVQPAAQPLAEPVSTVQARVGQRRRPGPR